jgi:hypothetical protein
METGRRLLKACGSLFERMCPSNTRTILNCNKDLRGDSTPALEEVVLRRP